jgi:prepilin peptidase CpaA
MLMVGSPVLSYTILIITGAILFYAALTDLKQFKIPNELIVVLAVLFVLYGLQSGQGTRILWNLGFAVLIFLTMLFFYSQHWVGGGDVKILTVAFLWVGIHCALAFTILLFVFATVHSVAATFGWAATQQNDGDRQKRIPFAPSVAAALVGTFMLGCLQPTS